MRLLTTTLLKESPSDNFIQVLIIFYNKKGQLERDLKGIYVSHHPYIYSVNKLILKF